MQAWGCAINFRRPGIALMARVRNISAPLSRVPEQSLSPALNG